MAEDEETGTEIGEKKVKQDGRAGKAMREKPKCPYCGAEMLDDSYTWICPKCRANSPVVIWDEELVKSMTGEELIAYAREAALHRAEIKKDEKEEAK